MLFLETVTLILASLYIFVSLYLMYGAMKQTSYTTSKKNNKITVLVPAKDEETNIVDCLHALMNQNINKDNYEVILLNDNSKDKTEELAKSVIENQKNFSVVNLSNSSENHLVGKSRAISIGVKKAKYDLVLICDADCKPNKNWVKTILEAFTDDVGIVSGFTLLEKEKMNVFDIVQNLDWIILQGVASGAAGISKPISCIGSNFAFRKSAYNEVGGYESLPFSITEDLLLYKTFSNKTKWNFIYPLTPCSINISKPMNSLKNLYEQRKRWAIGSLGIGGFGLFIMCLNSLAHILPVLTYFFETSNIYPLVSIFITDIIFFTYLLNQLKRLRFLKYIFNYFAYYYFNILCFPIMFLFDRKVVWKDRVYKKGTV